MRQSRRVVLAVVLVGIACPRTAPCRAEDPADLRAALERSLLPEGQPVEEMKSFLVARVPQPPRASDRAQWEQTAAQLRRDMLDQIVFRGTAAPWRSAQCQVEWLDTVAGGPGYRIRKFRYEALPGLWIPGLLYLPDRLEGLVPLALNVNGHAPEGKAASNKQLRSINLVKRGMLVLNLEWLGMGQLRTPGFSHYRMNQLDLCGASGLAPFYLAMQRGLDLGLALEHADPKRVVVSGLSGGGWQTIFISSLDQRVTLANPVAGYGSFRSNILFGDFGDSEQAPTDMGLIADYTHLTALRAPRPTLLTYNAVDDCCFESGHTLEPLMQAARPIFGLHAAEDNLRAHVNYDPGTHNFDQENREQLYAMLGDFFYPDDKNFVRSEIASEGELKTAQELHVPLPDGNLDFHRLAETLAPQVPRETTLPTDQGAAESWQRQQRAQLAALLKVPQYEAVSSEENTSDQDAYKITTRQFKIGSDWTVPAVEIVASSTPSKGTALVIADAGRASVAAEAQRLAAEGVRVLAADPLLWGESKIKARSPDYLFPLCAAALGQRPLGIQAAQLAGIARWARARQPREPVTIVATGPRASMAALVAAAIEPESIAGVELSGALASLKELIEQDKTVEAAPELFAFGLLAEFDVRQIVALTAPRPVTFRDPNERARRELGPLRSWYALLGASFSPAP